jgi:hypothetical protein
MKSNLLALVSTVALGIVSVLSLEAGAALFVAIGVTAIAVADYSRTHRPLVPGDGARTGRPYAGQPAHDLRLAV